MKKLQFFLQHGAFGVCTKIGERMGISISSVRLYFIYVSFLTFGSPILMYLILAFWVNVKKYWRWKQSFLVKDI